MLLKWEASILNQIYDTNIFHIIILNHQNLQSIDYRIPLQMYHQHIRQTEHLQLNPLVSSLLRSAHAVCKGNVMEEKRDHILQLNKMFKNIQKCQFSKRNFNIFHVIIFSSLSKCSIWPGMFKTSKKLIPDLVDFYANFFLQFNQFLQYKFDPLILSNKYNKIVKQIKEKKTAFPKLFYAVQQNKEEEILELIKQDKTLLNTCTNNNIYLSHHAAARANLNTLRFLLNLGIDYELLDEEQQTPIFYAIKRFDIEVIKFFVEEAKVNINHTQYQHRTPIYLAAFQGNIQIVEYLYLHGGNPDIQSKLSRTPLSKACYLGNVKVAEFLIKIGVKIQSIDSKGRTALHNAAWGISGGREGKRRGNIYLEDSPQCVQLLAKAGHKIDFQDFDKFTPLFSAISSHAEKSLHLLVKLGANLSHKTAKNETAVFIACKYGHLKILKILIEDYNCDYLQQNHNGYSPFAASLTTQDNRCTHYLMNLFLIKGNINFLRINILKCLEQFDSTIKLRYLLDWLNNNQHPLSQKQIFLSQSLHLNNNFGQYIWTTNNNLLKNIYIELLTKLKNQLNSLYISSTLEQICKNQYYTNNSIQFIINCYQLLKFPLYIKLNPSLTDLNIIHLLSINSNLTDNLINLYQTTLEIIKYRLTKVLLKILGLLRDQDRDNIKQCQKRGIFCYCRSDIMKLFYTKIDDKIAIIDYCLINGYYDQHKIIASFYNEYYELPPTPIFQTPTIPNYSYIQSPIAQIKAYLHPLVNINQLIDYDKIYNKLNQEEINVYKRWKQINKIDLNAHIVSQVLQLQKMIQHLKNATIVGIDVQHFSSSNQSFICLIQIATLSQVYIIDTFSYIHHLVQPFLVQLFANGHILKIFHSYDNDLKWIVEHYQIQHFHHLMDTAKLFHLTQGQKINTPSLKKLAKIFLQIEMNKEYQQCDWRIRPLFEEMIDYAAMDAKILPFLYLKMIYDINEHKKQLISSQIKKGFETKRVIKSIIKSHSILLKQ